MPKSKNHTYAAEYPKTQLLFNIFIFYKKFTEGFLTTKDAFFEYFLITADFEIKNGTCDDSPKVYSFLKKHT